MSGDGRHRRRSQLRLAALAIATATLGASLAACGGEAASDSGEAARSYPVKVVTAEFPATQRLGETTLLQIGVRNTGRRTIPALMISTTIAGAAGRSASIPFAVRDPQPGLAQPDRPVWVLSATYPRRSGSTLAAGAETSSRKSFDFGPLKPGATLRAVWKLSAVKAGSFTLLYRIDAGLGGKSRARTAGGVGPGGSFAVRISQRPPNTTVTDSGKVVTVPNRRRHARR